MTTFIVAVLALLSGHGVVKGANTPATNLTATQKTFMAAHAQDDDYGAVAAGGKRDWQGKFVRF